MSFKTYLKRGLRYVKEGVPNKNVTAEVFYLSPQHMLEGKNIIITGGSRGIGFFMAKKFIAEGANVIISGRDRLTLERSADMLGCKFLELDMLDVPRFESFINEANHLFEGKLNCLVNNAGVSLHEADFLNVTPESFDIQIGTNLKGSFFLTQKFLELLISRNQKGAVLFTSSETGETVDERPYGWTKAALNSLVRGLAYKLADKGFRINAIAPGITASDMTGLKSDGNLYFTGNIIERVYLPEEIAESACFLLSEAAGCMNGQIIVCNNGKTINARWK